jgi:Na+-driven multidrug efflux pump
MADEDELVVVADTDPEKRQREFVYTQVSNLLWTGVVIGVGLCICMFGLMQQFVEVLNTSDSVRELVQRYWFELKWWYWLGPIVGFVLMYLRARATGRKKLLQK